MEATLLEYTNLEEYGFQNMIRIFLDDDAETKATFLGFGHMGFYNMLDDYLIKCGVPVHRLHVNKQYVPIIKEAIQ